MKAQYDKERNEEKKSLLLFICSNLYEIISFHLVFEVTKTNLQHDVNDYHEEISGLRRQITEFVEAASREKTVLAEREEEVYISICLCLFLVFVF
jgi:hypothetical protein